MKFCIFYHEMKIEHGKPWKILQLGCLSQKAVRTINVLML